MCSRTRARRSRRASRSASVQRARSAAEGGPAKSAGTGSEAAVATVIASRASQVAVLPEVLLVFGRSLREGVLVRAVVLCQEEEVARLGVRMERRVDRGRTPAEPQEVR